ncbi:MAG: hypothetical protein IH944_04980 [Armatimonadetes bacterium]|nr:hypothetical protein [Armatimonadota bacterium]
MKLYLTALILGTCLVLAGCPAKETVETTETTENSVSSTGPDKTDPGASTDVKEADEDK